MTLMGYITLAYLVILDIDEFDVILGISWLSSYGVILNSYTNTITKAMLTIDKLK